MRVEKQDKAATTGRSKFTCKEVCRIVFCWLSKIDSVAIHCLQPGNCTSCFNKIFSRWYSIQDQLLKHYLEKSDSERRLIHIECTVNVKTLRLLFC